MVIEISKFEATKQLRAFIKTNKNDVDVLKKAFKFGESKGLTIKDVVDIKNEKN